MIQSNIKLTFKYLGFSSEKDSKDIKNFNIDLGNPETCASLKVKMKPQED